MQQFNSRAAYYFSFGFAYFFSKVDSVLRENGLNER